MRVKAKTDTILKRFIVVAVAILVAICGITFLRDYGGGAVQAETESTVTIHVYDPASQYSKLVGWIWIRGSSGDGVAIDVKASADAAEEFKKGDNAAHAIDITFTAAQTELLKSGKLLGFLVCVRKSTSGSWNDMYDKEGLPDVYVDLSGSFDANNHADVYFVRKDNEAFTTIEEGKMALEKITSAKFVMNDTASIDFETSSAVAAGKSIKLYEVNGEGEETEVASVAAASNRLTSNGLAGRATFSGFTFNIGKTYNLGIEGFNKKITVSKEMLIDNTAFINAYESADTQNAVLGATYTKERTVFRVWAPFASSVSIKTYAEGTGGSARRTIDMEKETPPGKNWGGLWVANVVGDLNKTYYTYSIVNNGVEVETIDPYAKACGANGERGMVVDLSSTNPAGWNSDTHLYRSSNPDSVSAADNPIVWEIHVKDFSSSADSGMMYKGKYLAFTEQNTTVPGQPSLKTGLNYLKDLGITYIHLNPVYDFATVDESGLSVADDTKNNFNWGYDPQNYNIPEGSYSTDPAHGEVRIKEFKQMVQALHNAGIGVIMDVVYNHTYSVVGQSLNNTVPGYYHRTTKARKWIENKNEENGGHHEVILDSLGRPSWVLSDGSGCGNETASERTMFRKYIVDSILYWATEYHIDGFRFDLMGLHDMATIKTVREALDTVNNGTGSRLLMYGEPWGGFGATEPDSMLERCYNTKNLNLGKYTKNSYTYDQVADNKLLGTGYTGRTQYLPWNVAVFNDAGRNGLRGDQWAGEPHKGWANNGTDGQSVGRVKMMMEGGCGSEGRSEDSWPVFTGCGTRNVAYAAAHDNFTLWDHLVNKRANNESINIFDKVDSTRIKQAKLVYAACLSSTGIVFMLAGDEMGRTKYGNENSYNTPSKLNALNWTRQQPFSSLYNTVKNLIKMRRDNTSTLFSYYKSRTQSYCTGNFTGSSGSTIKFTRTQGGVTLTATLNASSRSGSVKMGSQTENI